MIAICHPDATALSTSMHIDIVVFFQSRVIKLDNSTFSNTNNSIIILTHVQILFSRKQSLNTIKFMSVFI